MRAFEFYNKIVTESQLETPKADAMASELNKTLDTIIAKVKNFKKPSANEPKTQQPVAAPVESLDESTLTIEQRIAAAEDKLKTLRFMLSSFKDPKVGKIITELENDVKDLKKTHQEEVEGAEFTQRGKRREVENPALQKLAGKVTGTLEAIEAHYLKQAQEAKEDGSTNIELKKAPPVDAVTREIITIFDGTLEGLRDQTKSAKEYNALNKLLLDFIKASIDGVVPLKELLDKGSGNIVNEVPDSKWGKLKENGFIRSLMEMKPAGSGAGKWGPGEVGLAVLGSPVNKMGKGDLNVDGKKFELKASASPKSGGRINASKAIKKGSDGQAEFMKAWESFSPNLDIDQSGNEIMARKGDPLPPKSRTKIKVTSIGGTWVAIVNAALTRSKISSSELGAFLQDVLRAPINDAYKNKVKFESSRMISNEDGKLQINGAGLLSEYIGQCMKLYNETDGVEDILVINPTDGHFEIINALDNAGIEAKVNSGAIQTSTTWIDFDDPQMLATPQLGTITPT